MTVVNPSFIDDLQARGLVSQMTGAEGLKGYLQESRTAYCGFDPTANSLHIGSLVPLLCLRRFQLAGHKPIALVGGATGLIGDPSGKTQERSLNTVDTVAEWTECLRQQVSQFIDFDCGANSAEVASNLEWFKDMPVLSFLRDVGKHFSINNMIHKESVKQRIDREGEGISYTEFTYMILQSYDFAELYKRYGCTLQIGGSDQWGNITGGVDLVRRLHGGEAHGMTFPLVTKTDGTKFGKTESGTIWLDPQRTSPYAFYQFWLKTQDADVYRFLRYFTFIDPSEIGEIEQADVEAQGKPQGQQVLADQVTKLVHGDTGLAAAQRITEALFHNDASNLSEQDLEQLKLDGIPSSTVSRSDFTDKPLTQFLTQCGMVSSGKEVKDALGRGAVVINNIAKTSEDNMNLDGCFAKESAYYNRFYLVKLGKKKYHLIEVK